MACQNRISTWNSTPFWIPRKSPMSLQPVKKSKFVRNVTSPDEGSTEEYVDATLDLTIRKTWGGGSGKDPLLDKSTYIWNMDIKSLNLDGPPKDPYAGLLQEDEAKGSGFLSLARSVSLDSMDIDLSKELVQTSDATLDIQVAAVRSGIKSSGNKQGQEGEKVKWRFAPTKKEQKIWDKAKKFTTGGSESLLKDVASQRNIPEEERMADLAKFEQLKTDLQIFTLGIGLGCCASTYFTYSLDVALSYGVGLIGSIVYVRMLSNGVEAIGASSVGAAAKGALGQPRLFVPVVLVMTFNRWNEILVPQYEIIPLQLIPMLVGFFTYKAATLLQTFREVLDPYNPTRKSN